MPSIFRDFGNISRNNLDKRRSRRWEDLRAFDLDYARRLDPWTWLASAFSGLECCVLVGHTLASFPRPRKQRGRLIEPDVWEPVLRFQGKAEHLPSSRLPFGRAGQLIWVAGNQEVIFRRLLVAATHHKT
jgi:hypothetical protein